MGCLILKLVLGPNGQYFFEVLKFDLVEYFLDELAFSEHVLLQTQLVQIYLFDFFISLKVLIVFLDFDTFIIKRNSDEFGFVLTNPIIVDF